MEGGVRENKAGGWDTGIQTPISTHWLNMSLDTKDCTWRLAGERKYIHTKTTRTQATYGTDQQKETL